VACDFDRTLVGENGVLEERTIAAIGAVRAAGIPFVVVTGRMFRSVRPHLERAGIADPVVCYQGALVADPSTGEFLFHRPLEVAVAREAIAELEAEGYSPNCYVDDGLYVSRHTEASRTYAEYQGLPVTEVGDLRAWLERPPTKLVAIGEPAAMASLRDRVRERFSGRLFATTSLPIFLELGNATVSKGTGLEFVADRLGAARKRTIAFGDGENDIELLLWAGFGIAVANAHPLLKERADWTCPGPDEQGVAQVLEEIARRVPTLST
jgi:Cof subfamily protein (haloacid dehalogenase superfamily)